MNERQESPNKDQLTKNLQESFWPTSMPRNARLLASAKPGNDCPFRLCTAVTEETGYP